jgi:hypothetical protein
MIATSEVLCAYPSPLLEYASNENQESSTIAKMPSLSSTYLIPAIILNPALILHLINTFHSHMMPPPTTISYSAHPIIEGFGPLPGSTPYMDMHADDTLCWRYTILMVFVQLLAFGRVSDNRVQKKTARAAAKAERERLRKEKSEKIEVIGVYTMAKLSGIGSYLDGTCDFPEDHHTNGFANGNGAVKGDAKMSAGHKKSDSEESMTETSEEEVIV